MTTEAEIRRWVREEHEEIRQEEQSSCRHLHDGTLHLDGVVTCDLCGKTMTREDVFS